MFVLRVVKTDTAVISNVNQVPSDTAAAAHSPMTLAGEHRFIILYRMTNTCDIFTW